MFKLIGFIKKYKALIIVFGAILLVLFLIANKKKDNTLVSTAQPLNQTQLPLILEQISPAGSSIKSIWPVEPITFIFSLPIDSDSIVYEIEPQTETKISFDPNTPNQFSIIPLTGWEANRKYVIKINYVESIQEAKLPSPIQTEFTRFFDPEDLPNI